MICSAAELGLGDDHDGIIVLPADAGEPGQDVRVRCSASTRRSSSSRSTPTGPTRCRCAASPARCWSPSTARPASATRRCATTPAANDDGHPVVVEDAGRLPGLRRPHGHRLRPGARPRPDFIAQRLTAAGMRPISLAVDVTNYVMLETGRPIHGYDADRLQGPLVVRRAREGERLTTLDGTARTLSAEDLVVTDDSGIIGLGGVMGGETTEMSATHDPRPGRGGPLGRHLDVPHRPAAQDHLRGRQAQRARRRRRPSARPRPTGWSSCSTTHGGGQADPGVTVVGTPPAMPVDHRRRRPRRPRLGARHQRGAGRRGACAPSAARSPAPGTLEVTPPPWRPDLTDPQDTTEEVIRLVGYDTIPSVLPQAPGRSRPDPPPAAAPPDRSHHGRRRVRRGGHLPVRRRGRPRRPRAAGRRRAADDAAALQPAQQRGAGHDDDAAAGAAAHGRPQRRPGRGVAGHLRGGAGDAAAGDGAGARSCRWTGDPPTPSSTPSTRPCPTSRCTSALVATGERERPAGGARAARSRGPTPSTAVRAVAEALGLELTTRARRGRAVAPRAGARRCCSATCVVGHAGELHPRGVRGLRPAAALGRGRGRPRRAARARRAPASGAELLVLPGRQGGRRPRRRRPPCRRPTSRPRCAREPASCSSRSGSSTSTPAPRSASGKKSLAFALRFRAPDRTLKEGESAAARDAAVRLAAERTGAVQR